VVDVVAFTTPWTSLVVVADDSSSTFPLEGEEEVPTVAAKLKLVELVAAVLGAVSNEEVAAIEVVVSGRALICTAAAMPLAASSCVTSWATALRLDSEDKNSDRPLVISWTSTMNSRVCTAASLLPLSTSWTETAFASTFSESATASCTESLTLSTSVPLSTSRTKSKLAESEVTSVHTCKSQVVMFVG